LDGETSFDTKQRRKLRNVWITGRQGLTEREAAAVLICDSRSFLQKELGLADAKWGNQDSDISSHDSQSPSEQSVRSAQEQYQLHDEISKCREQTVNWSSPLLLKERQMKIALSDISKRLTERERRNSLLSGYKMQNLKDGIEETINKCLSPELNNEDYVSSSPFLKCGQNKNSQICTSRKLRSKSGKVKNSKIVSGSIPQNAFTKRSIFKSTNILSKELTSESIPAGKPRQAVPAVTNQTHCNERDSSNSRTVNCSLSKESRDEQNVSSSSSAPHETSDSSPSVTNKENNKFCTEVNQSIDYFGSPIEISDSKLHEKTQQFKQGNKPQISNEPSSENVKREATIVSNVCSNKEECLRSPLSSFRITDSTLIKNNGHVANKCFADEYLLNDNMNQEHQPLKKDAEELGHKILDQNINTLSGDLCEEVEAREKVAVTGANNKRGSSDFFSSPLSGGNCTLRVENDNQSPILFGDSLVMNTQLNNMLDGGCDEHPTIAEWNRQNEAKGRTQILLTDHIVEQVPYDVKDHQCLTPVANCGISFSQGECHKSWRERHKHEEESSPMRSVVSGLEILNSSKLDTENAVSELNSCEAEVNGKLKENVSFKKQSRQSHSLPKGIVTANNVMKRENNEGEMLDKIAISSAYHPEVECLELHTTTNIVRDPMERRGIIVNLSSSGSTDREVSGAHSVYSEELDFRSITEQTAISPMKCNFKTKKGLLSPATYHLNAELQEKQCKPLKETVRRKRKPSISNDFSYSESELSIKKGKRISNKCKIDNDESEMGCVEREPSVMNGNGNAVYWLHTENETALQPNRNALLKGQHADRQKLFTCENETVSSVAEQNVHTKKQRVNEMTAAKDADCITDSFFERAFDTYWDLDDETAETKRGLGVGKGSISTGETNPLHELPVSVTQTCNKPDTKDELIPAGSASLNQKLTDKSKGGEKVNEPSSIISHSFLEAAFSTSWEEKSECKEIKREIDHMKQNINSDAGSNIATKDVGADSDLGHQELCFGNKATEGLPSSKKSGSVRRRSPRLLAAAVDREKRNFCGSSAEVCKLDLMMKWVFPSGDVQVYLWMLRCGNIVLLTLRLLDVAKFTNLTPLSLLISYKLSFPTFGLKMSSLPTLALTSFNIIFMWYSENFSAALNYKYFVMSVQP
jgi:hypothetical protein